MTRARVALFAGDGIGLEVIADARPCVDRGATRCGLHIERPAGLVGGGAIDRYGTALPTDDLRLAMESDATLLGAVGRLAHGRHPAIGNASGRLSPDGRLA